jgi:hypothetical protein
VVVAQGRPWADEIEIEIDINIEMEIGGISVFEWCIGEKNLSK